ncbi:MAG: lipase, partial [Caldiserica bacterium]
VETTLYELMKVTDNVFVGGLSLGGTLSLHMAENHPDRIKGIFPINPAIRLDNPLVKFIWLLKYIVPSIKAPPTDTRDRSVKEINYNRIPTQTVYELYKLLRLTDKHLDKVKCPVMLLASFEDHIVPIEQKRYIFDSISSSEKEFIILKDSYHTATLDLDKNRINKLIIEFIERHL